MHLFIGYSLIVICLLSRFSFSETFCVIITFVSLVVGIAAANDWNNTTDSYKKLKKEHEELKDEFYKWRRYQTDWVFTHEHREHGDD